MTKKDVFDIYKRQQEWILKNCCDFDSYPSEWLVYLGAINKYIVQGLSFFPDTFQDNFEHFEVGAGYKNVNKYYEEFKEDFEKLKEYKGNGALKSTLFQYVVDEIRKVNMEDLDIREKNLYNMVKLAD